MDCAERPTYANDGCSSGYFVEAFRFAKDHGYAEGGVNDYKGVVQPCQSRPVLGKVVHTVNIASGDEEALKNAVATQGPVAVIIRMSDMFEAYASGVKDDPDCNKLTASFPNPMYHSVLVVGYGNEGGKDYWLVKNSWGKNAMITFY